MLRKSELDLFLFGKTLVPSQTVQSLHRLFNTIQMSVASSSNSNNKNLICSPFNTATCMSMVADGTAGTSREELNRYFNFAGPDQKIALQDEALKTFNDITAVQSSSSSSSISDMVKSAQGIFVTKSIQQSYIRKVTNDYRALAKHIDPADNASAAVKEINDFVSKATEGNITDLVSADCINPDTIMVLVAALFFKGKWASKFEKHNTTDRPFYISSPAADGKQQKKQVPTMYHEMPDVKVTESNNVLTVAIPYVGKNLYLVLEMARPATKDQKFAPLPAKSDATQIMKCVSDGTRTTEREIYLPKFKARTTISNMKDLLEKDCGVKEIFAPKQNDFHPIVGGKPSDPSDVYVSAIIHQAMVEVDEEGTVAAAATAVVLIQESYRVRSDPPLVFDHPFYFHIVDKVNGSILFSGSIVDPTLQ